MGRYPERLKAMTNGELLVEARRQMELATSSYGRPSPARKSVDDCWWEAAERGLRQAFLEIRADVLNERRQKAGR